MGWIVDLVVGIGVGFTLIGWILLVLYQAAKTSHVYYGEQYDEIKYMKEALVNLIQVIFLGWAWPLAAITLYIEEKLANKFRQK